MHTKKNMLLHVYIFNVPTRTSLNQSTEQRVRHKTIPQFIYVYVYTIMKMDVYV